MPGSYPDYSNLQAQTKEFERDPLAGVKMNVSAPEVKSEPKLVKQIEARDEEYFEFFAGSKEKAKPFLDFFKDLKNHE